MEPSKQTEALFSHIDNAAVDAPSENTKPAVYTTLFSGENTSGQVA
ncbi:hypothetical protein [Rhodococcus sp. P1Y]|nr:hypothetical protein [Rhodococcus sp. P1Y]